MALQQVGVLARRENLSLEAFQFQCVDCSTRLL